MISANSIVYKIETDDSHSRVEAGELVVGDTIKTFSDLSDLRAGTTVSEIERIEEHTASSYYNIGTASFPEGTPLWIYDWRKWVNVEDLEPEMVKKNNQLLPIVRIEEERTFLYLKTTPAWYNIHHKYDHDVTLETGEQFTVPGEMLSIVSGNYKE